MMMTDISPNAEVSHFLRWLKTKDGVGVYVAVEVGEISTAGLKGFILPLCDSLQSLTHPSSDDWILQSHSPKA